MSIILRYKQNLKTILYIFFLFKLHLPFSLNFKVIFIHYIIIHFGTFYIMIIKRLSCKTDVL